MADSIAIISSSAPYSSAKAQDALELCMVHGTYGQQCALFIQGDGVFQLLSGQDATQTGRKAFHKTFAALPFYDVDDVFICAESLTQRGILLDSLVISPQVLNAQQWQNKLAQFDVILRF
ncbi:sulfurtransferase complex subunit TusC [Neptunicella marina]|uniref:Sulfurtransferase complex subunit TusC n=1 Tax=Neptunicella marina TaxID=2125989 RepID=A0A8J6M3R4_9ALTE|nr:sulfurtransferase complex subunit TusC [Neptunicella marina]MBC3767753.1 sulfurtransferase complex subunit TusC [Neptunicella marina]